MKPASKLASHPWYARIRLAMDGPPRDDFRPLTHEELARLTPAKRARLTELLEQEAAERASRAGDDRDSSFDLLFKCFMDHAETAEDADQYWHTLELHEQSKHAHYERLRSARPPEDSIEKIMAQTLAELREATRLAIVDGFPPPGYTDASDTPRPRAREMVEHTIADGLPSDRKQEPPRSDSSTRRSSSMSRKVVDELPERSGNECIADDDRVDDHRLLPYRDKSNASSWQPPSYLDD